MHTLKDFVERFRGAFTAPTYTNFAFIALSWIWTGATGTVTSLLRARAPLPADIDQDVRAKHFSVLYRFFTRANWCADELGHRLFRMLASRLSVVVLLAVDDTLCRRTGLNVMGAGIFVDPLRKDRKSKRKVFSFGVNFVVLSVWIELPFMSGAGMMVPVLWRLYRTKKTCPSHLYKTQNQLAVEMLEVISGWLDAGRQVRVVADSAYICGPVGNHLPANFHLIGPVKRDAALYSAVLAPYKGTGCHAKWGPRLDSVEQLCLSYCASPRWLNIYSRRVGLLLGGLQVVWKPLGNRRIAVVLTRDPTGRYESRAIISTCPSDGMEFILKLYARRWRLELIFREVKQLLGMEKVSNGFCQVPGRAARPHGAQAPMSKTPLATARTASFALLCYTLVVAWFVEHGNADDTLAQARQRAPWYRHKRTLSFGDMLDAMRQAMWIEFPPIAMATQSSETHLEALRVGVTECGQSAALDPSAVGTAPPAGEMPATTDHQRPNAAAA